MQSNSEGSAPEQDCLPCEEEFYKKSPFKRFPAEGAEPTQILHDGYPNTLSDLQNCLGQSYENGDFYNFIRKKGDNYMNAYVNRIFFEIRMVLSFQEKNIEAIEMMESYLAIHTGFLSREATDFARDVISGRFKAKRGRHYLSISGGNKRAITEKPFEGAIASEAHAYIARGDSKVSAFRSIAIRYGWEVEKVRKIYDRTKKRGLLFLWEKELEK